MLQSQKFKVKWRSKQDYLKTTPNFCCIGRVKVFSLAGLLVVNIGGKRTYAGSSWFQMPSSMPAFHWENAFTGISPMNTCDRPLLRVWVLRRLSCCWYLKWIFRRAQLGGWQPERLTFLRAFSSFILLFSFLFFSFCSLMWESSLSTRCKFCLGRWGESWLKRLSPCDKCKLCR